MKKWVLFFGIVLGIVACSEKQSDKLEQALTLAGNNRMELEKVLFKYKHQPEDSLRYKAAFFLISNMPGKYSEDSRSVEDYKPLLDEWDHLRKNKGSNFMDDKVVFDSLLNVYHLASQRMKFYDIHHIKADYLIRNIDLAFEVWEKQPWGRKIPFDVFCEEILPYRLGTEPLENWREAVLEHYALLYDTLQKSDFDAFTACTKIWDEVGLDWYQPPFDHALPEMSYSMLEKFRSGGCEYTVAFGIFIMRALGVPVTRDYTPQWPHRNMGHSWSTVRTEEGKHIHFIATDIRPGAPHKEEDRMAKVFRQTFEIQTNTLFYLAKDENIPNLFQNPCMIDVSFENFQGYDVTVNAFPADKNCQFVYLSVFNNRDWVVIQWAKKQRKTIFHAMGGDVVYLPVYYKNGNGFAYDYPFLLTQAGEVHRFKPDTTKHQTLALYRKYLLIKNWLHRMTGGQFQAANRSDFSDAVTLHTVLGIPDLIFHDISIDIMPYRYFRYIGPDGGQCNIAELQFFTGDDPNERITGEMIGTPGSWNNDPRYTFDKAFDGDVLTFFDSNQSDGAWVGMDFGRKTKISKIRYLPRNDDNNIVEGQLYELFYWGERGWTSLGQQIAKEPVLYYHNAPNNALFLLRNLSKGKEERIFSYENGNQVFW